MVIFFFFIIIIINSDVLLKNCLLKFKIHFELSFVSIVILAVKVLREALLNCGQYEGFIKTEFFVFVMPVFCVNQFCTCREL